MDQQLNIAGGSMRVVWHVQDLADHFGVSAAWVLKNASRMGLPHHGHGDAMTFDPGEIDRWVAARRLADAA
ncbi:helix-turn-helix domain-containing protein [Uniformispora flossi]|uniref:helix-turn-helix domain-containing protein n=1 Tax=Uniformispora flossi TaxID=3390723 RepID=UPI003C2D2F8A